MQQPRLDLRLSQRLVLTPTLQQAIKLLQYSRQELVQYIRQELLENPTLEEIRAEPIGPAAEAPAPAAVDAEAGELFAPVAEPQPEVEAAVGQDVHRGRVLGHAQRVVEGQEEHPGADAQAGGARGDGRREGSCPRSRTAGRGSWRGSSETFCHASLRSCHLTASPLTPLISPQNNSLTFLGSCGAGPQPRGRTREQKLA